MEYEKRSDSPKPQSIKRLDISNYHRTFVLRKFAPHQNFSKSNAGPHIQSGRAQASGPPIFSNFDKSKTEYKEFRLGLEEKHNHKVRKLLERLTDCSKERQFICNHCGSELVNDKGKVVKKEIHCLTRFCMCENCILVRYAQNHSRLQEIGFFGLTFENNNYKFNDNVKVRHFAISFPRMHYPHGWKKAKKKYEYVINRMFQKLRKGHEVPKGFREREYIKKHKDEYFFKPQRMDYIRVFDIARNNKGDLLHFHFACKTEWIDYKAVHWVKEDMIKRAKKKYDFHVQFFGKKHVVSARNCLGYFASRMTGIYGKDKFIKNMNVKKLIRLPGIYLLQDLIGIDRYVDDFYNSRVLYMSRGVAYGTNIVNNSELDCGLICPQCGKVDKKEVYLQINFMNKPPPPALVPSYVEKNPELFKEEYQKIITVKYKCPSCDFFNYEDDFRNGVCRWCYARTTYEYEWEQKMKKFDDYLKWK